MDLQRYKNLTWSGETYSLKEIVKSKGLPCLVMVSEGIYSTSEMASFSSGDVLKLEALKNIYSIIAQNAARSASTGNLEGYGPLVHIPVGYSARGSIVPLCSPSHIFTSVKSLIHAFPRYVSTCEPMEIYHGRAVKTIPEGDTLELQNDLLSGGGTRSAVSCMWRGERITLSSRNKVRLRILEDRRKYSVKDVMKHLKLPQGIEFAANSLNPIVTSELVDGVSNASQFTGTFLLKGVFREAIVIAHQCAYMDDGKKVGSIVVMQMADSQINELEFYVADQDDSNYEILLRNFSSTSPDKKPGVCLYADFITPTPVVPVRTWQHGYYGG